MSVERAYSLISEMGLFSASWILIAGIAMSSGRAPLDAMERRKASGVLRAGMLLLVLSIAVRYVGYHV